MKEASSSTASDPRQPSTARPYKQAYKLCSWLAIIFCAQSLVNMKNMENDLKQISMAMIVALNLIRSGSRDGNGSVVHH
ncbi:uncharacterized protein A4U43_C03F20650 [Asparagus officinalis]|uniref:Uncharacterized protein n=1 Tax=Asparagus officinalis TaxID=4686 RepID=A0A5P1FEH9_ASPOF|nr:uncharacterized protein A4U43_C03F20650 [Asparagus officinalis]